MLKISSHTSFIEHWKCHSFVSNPIPSLVFFFCILFNVNFRSSRSQMFLTSAWNFIKKETLALVFSCEFCEIYKNTFFAEHLWWLLLWLCCFCELKSIERPWKSDYLIHFNSMFHFYTHNKYVGIKNKWMWEFFLMFASNFFWSV